jgi:hypothetical protein
MAVHFRHSRVAVLVVAGLLLCQPGKAGAHPHLIGPWVSPLPQGGYMSYTFGPGEYLGSSIWRGPYEYVVSGCPTVVGEYELLMFTGTQGMLSLREGVTAPGWTVGIVDFVGPLFVYRHAEYKRPPLPGTVGKEASKERK